MVLPSQAQVPFSHAGSPVTFALEQASHGAFVFFNERRIPAPEHSLLHPGSPGITTGEYSVSGGSAHSRAGMGIGEKHAIPCDLIYVLGGPCGIRVHAAYVAISQVVGQDVNDVGELFFSC
jgi:hypothetical protein